VRRVHSTIVQLALHVRATRTFTDQLGKQRRNGEEWLVQWKDAETYIPEVYEEVVGLVKITTLNSRHYAVVVNPVAGDPPRPQLGKRKLVKGECSFFLQPGESLERGIQDVYVMGEDEGLILRAVEAFADGEAKVCV
jgi:major vault protein